MTCLRALLVLLFLAGQLLAQDKAWSDLDSADASTREAARKVIEAEPFHAWKLRALEETRPWASIEAFLALCQACPLSEGAALRPHLCESITTLRLEQMSEEQVLAAVRLTRLVCTRFGAPTEDERQQMIDLWSRFLPPPSAKEKVARELKELLSQLGEQMTGQ